MRGRPRLPARVKELRGTLHPEREPKNPARPAGSRVPAPPRGLSAGMRQVWLELAREVDDLGVFTASDYTSFRLMVRSVFEADHIADDVPHSARVRYLAAASAALQRFGLDPASRSRVESQRPATRTENPDDEFAESGLRVVR